jgi:two-component system alkaline phosphatase synthesis response regulator PhoP
MDMEAAQSRRAFNYRERVSNARVPIPLVRIIEREPGMGKPALDQLERQGFGIQTLSMATDVVQHLERLHPPLVIIETATRKGPALSLCRAIRCADSLAWTPLVLLAANPSEEERILALESGADDYIAASSSGRELVARVRAVIRRMARQQQRAWMPHISPPFLMSLAGTLNPAIRTGEIEIDPTAMKVSVRGGEVVTTYLEFRFLHYLVQNQARVFTREQLLDAIWGSQYVELRSVDACVRRLRRKIERDPKNPGYLKTIRGAGYSLLVGHA